MDSGFIKYGDFFKQINKIRYRFIGTKYDRNSLGNITTEISNYYYSLDSSNRNSRINILPGAIIYDTTNNKVIGPDRYSSNTGCMNMISFRTVQNVNNKITDINITNHISKLNDWSLADIPQALNYMLARKERKKIIAKMYKIDEDMEKIKILESIMQSEAWDEKILYEDLKEYGGD